MIRYGLIFGLASAGISAPAVSQLPPAPPPSFEGRSVYTCDVITISGERTSAVINIDLSASWDRPDASVDASDDVLASMPSSATQRRRGSPWRYAAAEISEGEWQLLRFETLSSQSDRTSVQFYKQYGDEPYYGIVVNSLFATGICSVRNEDS